MRTARRWVAWEPLDETAQRQLLRQLAYDGRTAEAAAAYEACRRLPAEELDLSPEPATTALHEAIQAGTLPPPVIIRRTPHNLPRRLTPLFGRQQEIARLTDYLIDPDYPLVVVTGVGGIGKSSLALAAGRQLLDDDNHPFPDGVRFVGLEQVEDGPRAQVRERVAAPAGGGGGAG